MLIFYFGVCGMIVLLIYPIQFVRLALNGKRTVKEHWWNALFLVLGKFPEALGQLEYFYIKLSGKKAQLIEYK
jgi:hypothetical protein